MLLKNDETFYVSNTVRFCNEYTIPLQILIFLCLRAGLLRYWLPSNFVSCINMYLNILQAQHR